MINFRAASIDDVELINALAKDVFAATYIPILSADQLEYMFDMMYSIPSLQKQIEVKGAQYFIASLDGEHCGYLSVIKLAEDKYYLDKVYILPSFQKRGLGRDMINFAIEYARSVSTGGMINLSLNVNRQNSAIGFYKNMGFEVVRSGDFDIGDGYFMNDYIMQINVE